MPQAPLPLVYPMTPSLPTSTIGPPSVTSTLQLELGYNPVPPNTPTEELEHLETPEPSPSTLDSSPCDLGFSDQVVDCQQTLDGASQGVSCLDVVRPSPHVQNVVLHGATLDNPSPCRRSSLSALQTGSHAEDLVTTQVLSQLPIEQDLDLVVLPRVLLPKRLSLPDASPKEKVVLMDSPEANYYRSLMSSIWAQPADLSPVKTQLDLRDALHVHHPNSNIKAELAPIQECKIEQRPVPDYDLSSNHAQPANQNGRTNNYLVQDQPGPARIPQSTRPEFVFKPNVRVENARGNLRSSRRALLDGYKSCHSSGADDTLGAFANAVLRRTGHLTQRSISPEIIPRNTRLSNPPVCNSSVPKSAPKIKQDGIQQMHRKSRLFNVLDFRSTKSEGLQSRAPAALPSQPKSDPRTVSNRILRILNHAQAILVTTACVSRSNKKRSPQTTVPAAYPEASYFCWQGHYLRYHHSERRAGLRATSFQRCR